MNHTAILNLTTDLGYKGFKEAYMRQIEDIAYHSLGFEERLYQLLQAQDVFLNVNFTRSFQPFHKHVSTFLTVNQAVKL